jgi:flavin-dependent dehydrogenase
MPDLIIVGGGPAGATAGLIAARAGARVRILDRATFPRHKLCGDTINPGALAVLRRLGACAAVEASGLRVDGMVVTGEKGVRIAGRYPRGLCGRAILRRDLDWMLLEAAIAAGCELDSGVVVRGAIVDNAHGAGRVRGVEVVSRAGTAGLRAPIVIAADGRRSTLAFGLGLARHPRSPRRWAVGGYFENAATQAGEAVFGEMHVRRHLYVGVAPLPGGLTNVCLVKPSMAGDAPFGDPARLLQQTVAADPLLRDRLAGATLVAPPVVLGPLAVEATGRASVDGLLVAGDAAGFVDPMTGDGLRFAIQGGELAARAALRVLAHGWTGVQAALAAERADAFRGKWRFNRALRAIVSSPAGVSIGRTGARIAPAVMRAIITHAGDCAGA